MSQERQIEKYTEDYLEHAFEKIQVEYRRKHVLEVLNKFKPRNILEIGCGTQSMCEVYSEFDYFTIVEPSTTFCKMAAKNIKDRNKVTIITDFFENQVKLLRDQKFDFIILSGLLHEVRNPKEFLKDVKKVCYDNTILHINVPNDKSFHLLWAVESGLLNKIGDLTPTAYTLQQTTTFDLGSLKMFVQSLGFKIINFGSYFMKIFNHKKMFDLLNDGYMDNNLLDGLDKLTKYFPENGSEIYVNCQKQND